MKCYVSDKADNEYDYFDDYGKESNKEKKEIQFIVKSFKELDLETMAEFVVKKIKAVEQYKSILISSLSCIA